MTAPAAARALASAVPAPYWLDRPERPAAQPRLVADVETDLVVVGGGFTGLWAALQAVEEDPGRRVVLLEGDRVAEGATWRRGCAPSTVWASDSTAERSPAPGA